MSPTVVAFAAPSGTGKTTLIERLIPCLRAKGYRVGAIKSDAHGVELDTPGKDTHRMRKGGADTTALVSSGQLAVFRDAAPHEVPLSKLIEVFFSDLDFVLLEGFRSHAYPTIVVRRSGVDVEGWREPANVVAIASDREQEGVSVIDLDDVEGIAAVVCGLSADQSEAPIAWRKPE